jgi:ribosome-associated protein
LKPAILAKHVAELAISKKAHDVVIMNLRGLSSVTDFFVVCSGDSDTQVKAIANEVQEGLKKKGVAPWQVEGGSRNWVIVDFVDVVVHVFHKQTRQFYNLERLWGDAKIQHVVDEAAPLPRPRKRTTTARPRKAAAKKTGGSRKKAASKKAAS